MSAKAFAYATGCKLLTLDTFAVIVAQAPPEATHLTVLADAQQDKVYVQEFERSGQAIVEHNRLRIEPFLQWAGQQSGQMWVTGPGLRKWAAHLPAGLRTVPASLWDPQPEQLLHLAMVRYLKGEQDDVWSVEPLYLRASAAERQWERQADQKR
jgi:tRNA threonylcarbamoyladenosine biosynthesis protein TsaB